ncbi:uncharacterized protein BP01DRAFT_367529 [Aspergillus saccharolyticus JOP 1030-1]|uniref:Uncharacterized protein n=1 Tax=Aspergillus saccharolyticus JOP 1030-1 TaxID=1450539 RepID=A0A318Z7U3_9EURO|nr:hypothetical protein BP01DRAFT_367529 [Aspergillus saccharolyticus JOP 1030-1]PYH43256.1 hypothetical protein BP01DRAFT_367529 [Aspergillus saccharolyticus JOP 1030-1]
MSLDFPNEKTIDLSLWDYLTDVDGLNADAPNQSRFNLAVEGFKKASEHFVSEHGTAVNAYEQMKDRDLTGGMSFEQWAQQNAPAFRIALQEFQATRHQVRLLEGEGTVRCLRPGFQCTEVLRKG